jgi:hypothetical protein
VRVEGARGGGCDVLVDDRLEMEDCFSRAGRFRKEVLLADLEPVMRHDLEGNGRFCDGDGEMQVILEFC